MSKYVCIYPTEWMFVYRKYKIYILALTYAADDGAKEHCSSVKSQFVGNCTILLLSNERNI